MRGLRRIAGIAALVAVVVASLALLGAASGCRAKPAAGDKCRVPEQLVCHGRDRALFCDARPVATPAAGAIGSDGSPLWVEVACKGSRGCARAGDVDDCDDTVAVEGDGCPRSPPLDYACTTDARALVCRDGRFGVWRHCRGPQGCQVVGGRNIRCDTSLGEVGDPCERPGTYACSVDRTAMLVCDGGTLKPSSSCRGAKGCFVEARPPATAPLADAGPPPAVGEAPHKIDCDDEVALEGDPCTQARRIACSVDHKQELACDGTRYAKKRECRRSDCRVDGTELFCD